MLGTRLSGSSGLGATTFYNIHPDWVGRPWCRQINLLATAFLTGVLKSEQRVDFPCLPKYIQATLITGSTAKLHFVSVSSSQNVSSSNFLWLTPGAPVTLATPVDKLFFSMNNTGSGDSAIQIYAEVAPERRGVVELTGSGLTEN